MSKTPQVESHLKNVDFDDVEVTILILAQSNSGLKAAKDFLDRRGWPTTVSTQIPEAIRVIRSAEPPDFFLISYDHPSPSIYKLPELVEKSGDITCVGFVERRNSTSTNLLASVKIGHKIFGQPSGPNIQRGLRRILGQRFNLDLDKNSEPEENSTPTTGDSGIILQKGQSSKLIKLRTSNEKGPERGPVTQEGQTPVGPSLPPVERKKMSLKSFQKEQAKSSEGATSEKVNTVGVFPVESPSTPGYFVLPPKSPELEGGQDSLREVQARLQSNLSAQNKPGTVESGFLLEVPKVSYDDWSKKGRPIQAQDGGPKAGIHAAYFDVPDPLPKARYIETDEMYGIDLAQIPTERPLSFSLYLHLVVNKKYFLYLRRGRTLQVEQKLKLAENKVREVFFKRADFDDFKKFWAAAKLEQVT